MEILFDNRNKSKDINTILLPEINNMIKKIDSSIFKNIILVGPRLSGKTTTVINYKNKHQLNGDIVILPDFNKLSDLIMTTNEKKLEVELIICEELIKYINSEKLLIFFEKAIDNLKRDLYGKCMARIYMTNEDINIEIGIILKSILSQLKKETNKKNIILIIDRFDWINNSNKTIQEILISFFPFFSRNIIISEDESILMPSIFERLTNSGYDIINVNYSKNILVLKKIIELKIKKSKCISSNLNMLLEDKTIEYLIKLSNGNLDIIFYIIDVISNLNYQLSNDEMIEFLKTKISSRNDIYSVITGKKLQI